jgi:hypothetical protein
VPQLGRSPLLIILVVFLFLFILLPLLNRGKSKNLSDKERAQRTTQAMARVTSAQKAFLLAHKSYTDHVADLIPLAPKLSEDLSDGFVVAVDTSKDGKTYLAQVASTVLALNKTVRNGKTVARTCLALKGAGKDFCSRDQPVKPITSTTETTQTTKS